MPEADYHYACDYGWWNLHYEAVKAGFQNESYTINDAENKDRNPSADFDLNRIQSKHSGGLSKDFLHYGLPGGGNSGFQAISLAYMLGAEVVLLLGYDMQGDHFFGKHPEPLAQGSPFDDFKKSFATIKEVQVINCTRQTALDCFPKTSLESALSLLPARASRKSN